MTSHAIMPFVLLGLLATAGRGFAEPKPVAVKSQPKASPSSSWAEEHNEMTWSFFPGIYRSYNSDVRGGEISILYKGLGACFGAENGKLKYTEVEMAMWLISLSTGPRFTEGQTNFQFTAALPLLPIFPYARWTSEVGHRAEFGFMAKVPIWTTSKSRRPAS